MQLFHALFGFDAFCIIFFQLMTNLRLFTKKLVHLSNFNIITWWFCFSTSLHWDVSKGILNWPWQLWWWCTIVALLRNFSSKIWYIHAIHSIFKFVHFPKSQCYTRCHFGSTKHGDWQIRKDATFAWCEYLIPIVAFMRNKCSIVWYTQF